jgi:hypothetical protein
MDPMDGAVDPVALLVGAGCVLLVALVVVLVVVSARRERERLRRVRAWAGRHGWTVVPVPAVDWPQLPGSRRRRVSLLLSGTVGGWPVAVAEYSYETESMADSDGRRSTTTHRLVVTAVRLPVRHAAVAVEPRGAVSRLGRRLFGDGSAATGDEAFDRRFRVRAADPAAARWLVGPALIAEHLAGRVPTWSLAGTELLSWRPGQLDDPEAVPPLAAGLVRVANLLGGGHRPGAGE